MFLPISDELRKKLDELDHFIETEIKPLQAENEQFFDHRREYARTDWENDGFPRKEWEDLLREMERRADEAGHLRLGLPSEVGGGDASNLDIAVIREHLAAKGLGLHNDLQDESSIVGNFPLVFVINRYGTEEQKAAYIEGIIRGHNHVAFALSEPDHGSDATWIETTATRDGDTWTINGMKRWNSQIHRARHDLVFARTSGKPGDHKGITAFFVPVADPGLRIVENAWTFNMPSDHATVALENVRVPSSAILGAEGEGLSMAQSFIQQNRIRQAAASIGAARYCIEQSVLYAQQRETFGKPLAERQALQFELADLFAECEMLRSFVFVTAARLDNEDPMAVSANVSIANYRSNRFVCRAADFAIQIHGGLGYSREKQFEHIYRHHRRYRITEGSDEIQIRNVVASLFRRRRPDSSYATEKAG
ncbi:MAG: acyl-CoA dehydrogenase family protein [Novosphingobium sp.]|nr:acyl-CoA dehydrogenase family protein [Novosphingobium sp.]